MATSTLHKGWLYKHGAGILAGVYNEQALAGAVVHGANTALDGVLRGTPVTPALAVDSMVLSNLVNNGDILIAASNGSNSQAWMWVDSSAGTMTFYGAGTAISVISSTVFEIEDNILLALGNDQDQVLLNRASTLAGGTALTGVLVGTPVKPALAANSLVISNVTADGDILVASQTGGNSAAWLWVDTSSNLMTLYAVGVSAVEIGSAGTVVNEGAADRDWRIEGDNNANMLVIDGGTDSASMGAAVTAGAFLTLNGAGQTRTHVTSVGVEEHHPAATFTTGGAGIAIAARIFVGIPTFSVTGAQTNADAATIYIAGQPAAAGDMTITRAWALWVDAGNVRFDANVDMSATASDLVIIAATAAALEVSDGTTKFYAFDTRVAAAGVTSHALDVADYTFASAAGNVVTSWALAAHTLNYTGTTQVTSEVVTANLGARTIAGDTATLTVDAATTLKLIAPIEGTNVTITATSALRIGTATGSPTTQYGIYIESLANGGTNRGIYLAGANGIQFGAADDIIMPAATASALEISDGTTKYAVFDTRVAVAGVTSVTLNISAYTMASAAGAVATGWSFAAHTLNLTGNTQVTSEAICVNVGARTIAADGVGGACTVDKASAIKVVAPVEGTNVTLTDAAAIRIGDPASGTPTNQYGIFIETLTAGATKDYAIWVAGANAIHVGTAGTATGLMEWDGATSGTVTVTVAAAAGTWTMTLPTSGGANTNQLATNGSGVCSWTAEASLREYKDVLGEAEPQDALRKLLDTKVYHFRYRPDARVSTLDYKTVYTGVMADDAPWAMQGEDWGLNLSGISTFGYTTLAIQAMAKEIAGLKKKLAKMGAN